MKECPRCSYMDATAPTMTAHLQATVNRVRELANAEKGEATEDAVERLVARARKWDLIRGKAKRYDEVEAAMKSTAIAGIMDEFKGPADAILQMSLHIRELTAAAIGREQAPRLATLFVADPSIPRDEMHVRVNGRTVARVTNLGSDEDIRIAVTGNG